MAQIILCELDNSSRNDELFLKYIIYMTRNFSENDKWKTPGY